MTHQPTLRFIAIPGSVLSRPDLSATDKIIYGLLRFHQYDKDRCRPSQRELADSADCSVRAVSNSIAGLEAAGLVDVERAYRQNNIYTVKPAADPTYLRVTEGIIRMEGLSALGKLIAAAIQYKAAGKGHAWPHQETLAAELGCSRRSIVNALQDLEASGKLDVHHGGGGRKRGNQYRPTAAFYDAVFAHGPADRVQKVHPLKNITKPEDSKRTAAVQEIPSAGLSACRRIEPAQAPEDRAFDRLLKHGVHRTVADSIVYGQHHPPTSIEQAIDNALLRQADHRQKGHDHFKPFHLAAYIVGSLNQARREAKIVKPSKLFIQSRQRHERAQQSHVKPWTPLPESDFEERRRRCLEQLRAAAG